MNRCTTWEYPGNTKGESITVWLTSCLTGFDWSVLQIKTKIVSCHAADPKTSQTGGQWYNNTSPLVFRGISNLILNRFFSGSMNYNNRVIKLANMLVIYSSFPYFHWITLD